MVEERVTIKAHYDALNAQRDRFDAVVHDLKIRHDTIVRDLEVRFATEQAGWIREKFTLHNNLLEAWRQSSNEDRATFIKTAEFDSLKEAFGVDRITATKALAMAEGRSKAYAAVVASIGFVSGLVIAFAGTYSAFHR
jgi:hypothetical protein